MIRQVTVASFSSGGLASFWVPADACREVNDLINIGGHPYIVMAIYPAVRKSEKDNDLRLLDRIRPWTEQDEEVSADKPLRSRAIVHDTIC